MKIRYTFFLLFLVSLFSYAQVPVISSITGPSTLCSMPAAGKTYTASATNSPTSYMWSVSPSAGVVITNGTSAIATISFSTVNQTYIITVTATNGSGTSAPLSKNVFVYETPNVTFSGSTNFCSGSPTALQASSTNLSASTTLVNYTWLPSAGLSSTTGPSVTAFPMVTTIYTLTGTIGNCSQSIPITITPKNSPTITVNTVSVDVCVGQSTTLTASGANSYTWTGGISNGVGFTPQFNNFYIVSGTGANGCVDSVGVTVNVNPYPVISAAVNPTLICSGKSATLAISGNASTFSINSNPVAATSTLSPANSTTYTIIGSTIYGCTDTVKVSIKVSPCVGIKENYAEANKLLIYPNPNNGTFIIKGWANEKAVIVNELGQIIRTLYLSEGKQEVINGLPNGIYSIISNTSRNRVVIIE